MAKKGKPTIARAGTSGSTIKGRQTKLDRVTERGRFVLIDPARRTAVLPAAKKSGLLGEKSAHFSGRISPALREQAKRQTGISIDTDLIEIALANVAIEDEFSKAFDEVRGTVDPSLSSASEVLAFDFDAAFRWGRLDLRRTLSRRKDAELPFIGDDSAAGHELLLDTCVYV